MNNHSTISVNTNIKIDGRKKSSTKLQWNEQETQFLIDKYNELVKQQNVQNCSLTQIARLLQKKKHFLYRTEGALYAQMYKLCKEGLIVNNYVYKVINEKKGRISRARININPWTQSEIEVLKTEYKNLCLKFGYVVSLKGAAAHLVANKIFPKRNIESLRVKLKKIINDVDFDSNTTLLNTFREDANQTVKTSSQAFSQTSVDIAVAFLKTLTLEERKTVIGNFIEHSVK